MARYEITLRDGTVIKADDGTFHLDNIHQDEKNIYITRGGGLLAPKERIKIPRENVTCYKESHKCFITTACAEVLGLPDNCEELRVLREFRDSYLIKLKKGKEMVQLYYEIAPALLTLMENDEHREEVMKTVFYKYIKTAVSFAKRGENREAAMVYTSLISYLIKRYGTKISNS